MLSMKNNNKIGEELQSINVNWAINQNNRGNICPINSQYSRVQHSKQIIKIKDSIQSIVSIGKLKKMELIAINNRSLFNYSKIKRAEQSIKRYNLEKHLFFPNLKSIKLDVRKSHDLQRSELRLDNRQGQQRMMRKSLYLDRFGDKRGRMKSLKGKEMMTVDKMSKQFQIDDKLIEDYLKQVENDNKIDIIQNKTQVILQACRVIGQKLRRKKETSLIKPLINKKGSRYKTEGNESCIDSTRALKVHRKNRSLFESEYLQEMNKINRFKQFHDKKQALNEKTFLRKIKKLKGHRKAKD